MRSHLLCYDGHLVPCNYAKRATVTTLRKYKFTGQDEACPRQHETRSGEQLIEVTRSNKSRIEPFTRINLPRLPSSFLRIKRNISPTLTNNESLLLSLEIKFEESFRNGSSYLTLNLRGNLFCFGTYVLRSKDMQPRDFQPDLIKYFRYQLSSQIFPEGRSS